MGYFPFLWRLLTTLKNLVFDLMEMFEITLQSKETGRIWSEIIHCTDFIGIKEKCIEYRIKIISVYPALVPSC